MKQSKFALINILTLVIGLGLMSGSFSGRDAEAARTDEVPMIRVSGLGNSRGQHLTILYVVGSRPLLSIDPERLYVDKIRIQRELPIQAEIVSVPSVKIERQGFRGSYNYIVFVVSSQTSFSWINDDQSLPEGGTSGKNRDRKIVRVLSKSEVDAFISSEGPGQPITIPIN